MKDYQTTLHQLGLSEAAIKVYEGLIALGSTSTTPLIQETGLSRKGVYDALDILFTYDLVEYEKKGRTAIYTAAHPTQLRAVADTRKRELEQREQQLGNVINQFSAAYNLTHHKPGVVYFEGEEAIAKELWSTLDTQNTIYTFVDQSTIRNYVNAMNDKYLAERIRRGVHKKIIFPDNITSRDYIVKEMNKDFSEAKIVSADAFPFHDVAVEIYDDSLLYLTATEDGLIGFRVEHPGIVGFQRSMFEFIWQQLPQFP